MTGGPPQKKQKQSFQNRRPDQVEPLHFDTDEALISYFEREAKKEFSDPYAKRLVSVLRKFSIWLCGTGRPPMAGRLNQQNVDMQAHAKVAGLDWELIHLLNTALAHLAEVAAGTPMNRRHATLGEHIKVRCIDDEALISYFRAAELGLAPLTVVVNARRLRRFSDWLGASNKEPLARRLHDDSLTQDAHRYQDQTILHALRWLRLALPTVEAVLECVGPALQVRQQGGVSTSTGSQHGSSHRGMDPIPALERSLHIPPDWDGNRGENRNLSTPGERRNDAQSVSTVDVAWPDAAEGGSQHSPRQRPDHSVAELAGDDIQNPNWQRTEDAMLPPVVSMLPWDQALGLPSSAGAADPCSGFDGQWPIEDFGYALGFGWEHSRQAAPDPLIGELIRKNRLPTRFHPASLNLKGRPYTAELTGETRDRPQTTRKASTSCLSLSAPRLGRSPTAQRRSPWVFRDLLEGHRCLTGHYSGRALRSRARYRGFRSLTSSLDLHGATRVSWRRRPKFSGIKSPDHLRPSGIWSRPDRRHRTIFLELGATRKPGPRRLPRPGGRALLPAGHISSKTISDSSSTQTGSTATGPMAAKGSQPT